MITKPLAGDADASVDAGADAGVGTIHHAHSENDVNAAAISENAALPLTANEIGAVCPRPRKSGSRPSKVAKIANRFKRISHIELSSSNHSNSNNNGVSCDPNGGGLDASTKQRQHYSSTPSLRHSSYTTNTLNPLVSVQSNSSLVVGAATKTTATPTATATTTTSSTSAISAGGNNTAKQHDQQTAAVAAISTTSNAAAAVGTSGAGAAALATATPAAGKEKKRKEVSSSRVKKFHRHFSQVSKDEKLINYFSCALVSDILLQGHLYITDQHFAFYSNVFGYVTKVVIPTSSVTKISKEKTAKIIPNAVGVATADERHVFGSFISRESAFRLMCSVCPLPLAPIELLPNKTQTTAADIEISEEYSIEDDSSCSISGNESPPQPALDGAAAAAAVNDGSGSGNGNGVAVIAGEGQLLIRRTVATASSEKLLRHSGSTNSNNNSSNNNSLNVDAHDNIAMRSSAPPGVNYVQLTNGIAGNDDTFSTSKANNIGLIIAGSISSSTSNASGSSAGPSTSSSPQTTVVGNATTIVTSMPTTTTTSAATTTTTPKNYARILYGNLCKLLHNLTQRLQQRSELHMLYVGIMLAILLALFSVFLLYRILDIEAKTKLYNSPVDFNWRGGNDEDIFAEALRWQRELQAKTTEEAQTILTKNLEQISKVRRSLETLSMLIHDRSTAYANPTNRDDSD